VTDLGSQKQGKLRPQTRPQPMTSTVTSAACLLAGLFQEHQQRECRQDLRLTINCQPTNLNTSLQPDILRPLLCGKRN
jgi:hypothetical protein